MDIESLANNFYPELTRGRQQTIIRTGVHASNLSGNAISLSQLDPLSYGPKNVAGTLVQRDTNGNFVCGTITGTTTGNELPLTFNFPFQRSINTISMQFTPLNKAGDTMNGNITMSEGNNFILGTATGTQIGTVGGAAGQKLGFYAATPIVQPLLATGAGHSVDDVITTLQNLGLVRQT